MDGVTEKLEGSPFTEIFTVPDNVEAEQFSSLSDVILYEVKTVGLTGTVIEGAVPLKGIVPFINPDIVPEPVTLTTRFAELPIQTDDGPVKVAVGLGLTVIVAKVDFTFEQTPLEITALNNVVCVKLLKL